MGFASLGWLLVALSPSWGADSLSPEVLQRAKDATVLVRVTQRGGTSQGSGFFVAKQVVVTNAHVLGMARDDARSPLRVLIVLHSGVPGKERSLPVKVLGVDAASDLAFLGTPGLETPATLTLDPKLRPRETLPVYIFGFPFGSALSGGRAPTLTVHTGSVSSIRLDAQGAPRRIQINGNLNPGNSGGPILDARGRIVGVSVSTIQGTTISFAVPASVLAEDLAGRPQQVSFVQRLEREGRYTAQVWLRMLDPLRRVKQVSLRVWTQPKGQSPQPREPQALALSWSKERSRYEGKLAAEAQAGETFWVQPHWRSADGKEERARPARLPLSSFAPAPAPRPAPSAAPKPGETPGSPEAKRAAPPAPLSPQRPERVAVLAARRVPGQGGPRDFVRSETQTRELPGSRLLQLVPAPDGSVVYGLHHRRSEVVAYDPLTFAVRKTIQVPRYPLAAHCDERYLVVACGESSAVLFFDRETHEPVRGVRIRDARALVPTAIAGVGRDGSYLSVWKFGGRMRRSQLLAVDPRSGATQELLTVGDQELSSAVVLDPGRVLLQGRSTYLWVNEPRPALTTPHSTFFGREWPDREVQRLSVTHDRRQVVFSLKAQTLFRSRESFVTDFDLAQARVRLPGAVVAEVPHERIFVTWAAHEEPKRRELETAVFYVGRHTGRVLREVHAKADRRQLTRFFKHSAVYVPGVERLIHFDPTLEPTQLQIVPCGPIAAPLRATRARLLAGEPPQRATPGQALEFRARVELPEGSEVRYRLVQGPHGAKVDPRDGTFRWKPDALSLGRWDVEIVAEFEGRTLPLAKWVLEVAE